MKTTESIGKLCEALAKAQGKFENPPRNRKVHVATKTGAGYDFHYATLDRILEQVRPILSENGLAIIQAAETKDGRVVVTSRLGHLSGEWIESELSLRPEDDDPQKCGSAITYGKRYLLTSMLGISADEDDDGNHASGNHVEKAEERPACPACGTNKSVIIGKPEYGGGFVCFAKKGGCGHKWHDAPKEADPFGGDSEPPKANGKKSEAKKIAEQHGVKTADQLEDTEWVKAIKQKLDGIDIAAADAGKRLTKAEDYIYEQHKAKKITDAEKHKLDFLVAELQKEIDAQKDFRANCMETDPAAA